MVKKTLTIAGGWTAFLAALLLLQIIAFRVLAPVVLGGIGHLFGEAAITHADVSEFCATGISVFLVILFGAVVIDHTKPGIRLRHWFVKNCIEPLRP